MLRSFQAAAYAVERYGVTAEQLGDMSKDVADKLGEFIATGGGEFKDFFEQVAPKVGLTADQLQGLSGPQVLVSRQKGHGRRQCPYGTAGLAIGVHSQ